MVTARCPVKRLPLGTHLVSYSHGVFLQGSLRLEPKSLLLGPGTHWVRGMGSSGCGVQAMVAVCVTQPSEKSDHTESLTPSRVGGSQNSAPHSTSDGSAFAL